MLFIGGRKIIRVISYLCNGASNVELLITSIKMKNITGKMVEEQIC